MCQSQKPANGVLLKTRGATMRLATWASATAEARDGSHFSTILPLSPRAFSLIILWRLLAKVASSTMWSVDADTRTASTAAVTTMTTAIRLRDARFVLCPVDVLFFELCVHDC